MPDRVTHCIHRHVLIVSPSNRTRWVYFSKSTKYTRSSLRAYRERKNEIVKVRFCRMRPTNGFRLSLDTEDMWLTHPNVPCPILASFSNFVAASQNGKLYSSKYFSRSRAMFICSKLGDGTVGGVNTPFRFVMAAVLVSVGETVRAEQTCGTPLWDATEFDGKIRTIRPMG